MSGSMRWRLPATLCVLLLVFVLNDTRRALAAVDAEANEPDVAGVLREFSSDWPEDRTPYRNPEDTESWKTYALCMKRLVAMGDKAVPGLIEGCNDANSQVRALSARVLGYLQAEASVPKLIELLNDKSASVALPAADALGQIQDARGLEALRSARNSEKRGDVLLHINKSLDRQVPLEDGAVEQILQIDSQSIDSAKVGQTAPDFTVQDPDGKPWTLSDQRGKKSVVLVFIYGDG